MYLLIYAKRNRGRINQKLDEIKLFINGNEKTGEEQLI